jgi:hypothetical protein
MLGDRGVCRALCAHHRRAASCAVELLDGLCGLIHIRHFRKAETLRATGFGIEHQAQRANFSMLAKELYQLGFGDTAVDVSDKNLQNKRLVLRTEWRRYFSLARAKKDSVSKSSQVRLDVQNPRHEHF